MSRHLSFILILFFTCNWVFASGGDHRAHDQKEHIQHNAHDHGVARLTLAVDGQRLEILLESPAANLVGFERYANTDEDRQKLAEAKAILAQGENLFRINPEAQCSLRSSEVESTLFEHDDHEGHDDHGEYEGHDKGDAHSDIDASWVFSCANPGDLRKVKTVLFASFPRGFEKIMVEWVTATSASAMTIDQDDVIDLK